METNSGFERGRFFSRDDSGSGGTTEISHAEKEKHFEELMGPEIVKARKGMKLKELAFGRPLTREEKIQDLLKVEYPEKFAEAVDKEGLDQDTEEGLRKINELSDWCLNIVKKEEEKTEEKPDKKERDSKAEEEELQRKRQISEDLDMAFGAVPAEIAHGGSPVKREEYMQENVYPAIDRLKEQGIDTKDYLKIEVNSKESLNELNNRKKFLLRIINKMRAEKDLSDEEQALAEYVGIKEEDILRDEDVIIVKAEEHKKASETQPENKPAKKNSIEEQLKNISGYEGSLAKKKSLNSLKLSLEKKGASIAEIKEVEAAIEELRVAENIEIQAYKDRGEMRPELREAVEHYYAELEKKYDSGGNMVNFYQKTPDFELSKLLLNMKAVGADGEELSGVLEKELFDIGILHDLRIMINNRDSVDKSMTEYAALLKGQNFDTLIHLQDRLSKRKTDNDFVTQDLAAIDEEARRIYHEVPGQFFVLEKPSLEAKILGEVGGGRLNYLIARDLYRVTGGEARYGISGHPIQDPDKGNSWVMKKNDDENNGDFYRGALNRRRDFGGAVDSALDGTYRLRYWPELLKHLDPGISSFWENIWKKAEKSDAPEELKNKFTYKKEIRLKMDIEARIPPRKYAMLTVDALRNLRLGVEEPGKVCIDNEIKFNVWMDDIGRISSTMSKERTFIGSPSFKGFQSVIGVDYYPIYIKSREKVGSDGKVILKPNGEPDTITINREQYLVERLGDLVEFNLKSNSMNPTQIATELEEYRKAGFLFKSEKELTDFMKKYGLPITAREKEMSNIKTVGKKLMGEPQGRREVLGVAGDMLGKFIDIITKP